MINRNVTLILFIISIICYTPQLLASAKSYGPIIHKQSQQIQHLKERLSALELVIQNLQKEYDTHHNKASHSIKNVDTVLGESDISSRPKAKKLFFDDTEQHLKQDKIDYEFALVELKNGKFSSSEKKFSDFIQKYPSSKLHSNATFWYAETFYRRGIFNKAAINYLQSYKKYPKAVKAPDALLKLSYSLASLNKLNEACSMLGKLESEFPQRPISSVKRAREASRKFKCK